MVGNDQYFEVCGSIYGCGTTARDERRRRAALTSERRMEAAKALLKEAGYDGKPIVVMHATDVTTLATQPVSRPSR